MVSEVPLADARGMLIEGDSDCSAWPTSPELSACATSPGVNTSIGTALSNTVRLPSREPNTVTASRVSAGAAVVSTARAPGVANSRSVLAAPSSCEAREVEEVFMGR